MPWLLFLIVVIYLSFLSLVDFKTFNKKNGYIPSIFTTAPIVFSLLVFPNAVYLGILGFAIAWSLYELDLYRGEADIKIITFISIILGSVSSLFLFLLMLTAVTVSVSYLSTKKITPSLKTIEIPYIPIILVSYLLTEGALSLIVF